MAKVFDDFSFVETDEITMTSNLMNEGALVMEEDGVRAADGILFSYIGTAKHPDTGVPISGKCAFIGIDGTVYKNAGQLKASLNGKKITSTKPLRVRALI